MEVRKKIQERRFYPLLISEGERSDEEDEKIWDTFDTLSEEKKESLLSPEIAETLQLLEKQMELSEDVVIRISIAVRMLFFGELLQENLESHLKTILEKFSGDKEGLSKEIAAFIITKILTIKPPIKIVEKEELIQGIDSAKTQKLQILQALSQFQNLGNQNITTERIRIKSQSEPVRGSLYNWIKCYRDELGIGQHSTVERGQFLFRSENGKRLSPEERERINLILKSIEENYTLDIDPLKQEIVFPEMHFEKALAEAPTSAVSFAAMQPASEKKRPVVRAAAEVAKSTPSAFFVPRQAVETQVTPQVVVDKFQSGSASVERSSINSVLAERQLSSEATDYSREAEKLKREPKPEWIKGAFTKENIPDKVKPESVKGTMSFSLNHMLPVEQETKVEKVMNIPEPLSLPLPQPPKSQPLVKVIEKQALPKPAQQRNQFHIRPVNRNDF